MSDKNALSIKKIMLIAAILIALVVLVVVNVPSSNEPAPIINDPATITQDQYTPRDRPVTHRVHFDLLGLLKQVKWPGESDVKQAGEVNICLLGPEENTNVRYESAGIKIKVVTVWEPPSAPGECHIVYFTTIDDLQKNIEESHASGALTVASFAGFVRTGGMIQFLDTDGEAGGETRGEPVFVINKKQMDAVGLQATENLLERAYEVRR